MARVLTTAWVNVAPDHEAEFLAVLSELAQRLAGRAQRVWLFRNHDTPGLFLEFTEGDDAGSHRMAGPADAEEAALEQRLQRLGRYDATATTRWDAIPLAH